MLTMAPLTVALLTMAPLTTAPLTTAPLTTAPPTIPPWLHSPYLLSATQLLEPDRRAKLQTAAAGEALDRLNRQAATLIATHGLHEQADPDGVGRWLCVGASSPTISPGELVMLLPPNMLLWEEEVADMNTCLQLLTTASGARLFSSSLTEHDLDNLICHSCDPNCQARRIA
jgi:hypothetical protein